MPSIVQICNQALAHLGAEALVTSIDPPDGSAEAGYCETYFGIARTEALEMGPWPWAMKRALLAPASNPSTVWAYAYAKPSDCLAAVRVLDGLTPEASSADFEIEGDLILTNQPEAVLKYKADVTDPTRFSARFSVGLGYLLASYLAGPVLKGNDGITAGARLRQQAEAKLSAASVSDANDSAETVDFLPAQLKARQ